MEVKDELEKTYDLHDKMRSTHGLHKKDPKSKLPLMKV